MKIHVWFLLANNLFENMGVFSGIGRLANAKNEIHDNDLHSLRTHRSRARLPYPLDHLWWRFSLASAIWHDDSETTLGLEPRLSRSAALILREKIHPGSAFAGRLVRALAIDSSWMWFWKKNKQTRKYYFVKWVDWLVRWVSWDWLLCWLWKCQCHLITCISFVSVSLYCRQSSLVDSTDYTYKRRPT